MLVHHRVTSSIKLAGTELYTWVERGSVGVKCIAQEHNTTSPARASNPDRSIQRRAHRPCGHRASHKLMYLGLKCIFCVCLQKSVGWEKCKCYNNGRSVDTCHVDMFYCHCTELYRGKQCKRFKCTRPDGYCIKYVGRVLINVLNLLHCLRGIIQ